MDLFRAFKDKNISFLSADRAYATNYIFYCNCCIVQED